MRIKLLFGYKIFYTSSLQLFEFCDYKKYEKTNRTLNITVVENSAKLFAEHSTNILILYTNTESKLILKKC